MRHFRLLIVISAVTLVFLAACQPKPISTAAQYDRAALQSFVDKYLDAVIAHDPAQAPLAATVKFTENGQRLIPGDGLWNTASVRGSYHLYVADPQAGQVGYFGTIRENGVPAILGLRLKIEKQAISEIETFVVRDTTGAQRLEKLGAPHPVFAQAIPDSERLSRAELITAANKYFTALERNDGKGEYNFTDDCNRLENGKQTSNNPAKEPRPFDIDGMSCKAQFETGFFCFVTRIRDRRFVVVDEERGIVLAFAFFDHAGNVLNITLSNGVSFPGGVNRPWTWEIAEIFKVENGLLRQIEALFQEAPYGMNSGWSAWEQGLSSAIQQ
ncbi:MAG TPA: hypothetical protein PLP19_04810 [bacterium]|nr:hypothetical protein [bacterium]HPN42792.1 hypothetical protein [bacterium]